MLFGEAEVLGGRVKVEVAPCAHVFQADLLLPFERLAVDSAFHEFNLPVSDRRGWREHRFGVVGVHVPDAKMNCREEEEEWGREGVREGRETGVVIEERILSGREAAIERLSPSAPQASLPFIPNPHHPR